MKCENEMLIVKFINRDFSHIRTLQFDPSVDKSDYIRRKCTQSKASRS